jgi:hypothetical protein
MKSEEGRSDQEVVDHHTGLANGKISTAFHDVFGILIGSDVVVAHEKVQEPQVSK